jgi:hypothetical protein
MDVTQLESCAYIKIAELRGRNARECHSELVETVGNNDKFTVAFSTIPPSQYGYFNVGTLF